MFSDHLALTSDVFTVPRQYSGKFRTLANPTSDSSGRDLQWGPSCYWVATREYSWQSTRKSRVLLCCFVYNKNGFYAFFVIARSAEEKQVLILVEGSSYQSNDCVSKGKYHPSGSWLHGVGVQRVLARIKTNWGFIASSNCTRVYCLTRPKPTATMVLGHFYYRLQMPTVLLGT